IVVADPLLLSETWAGMLAGAAARGSQVEIIAPALANAPNAEAPVVAVARQILTRLLAIRDRLGTDFRASGGDLRIGLYAGQSHGEVGRSNRRDADDRLGRHAGERGRPRRV